MQQIVHLLPYVRREFAAGKAITLQNAERNAVISATANPLKKQKTNLPSTTPNTKKPGETNTKEPKALEKSRPVTAEDEKRQREILDAIYLGKFDPQDFRSCVGNGCCVFHNFASHTDGQCFTQKKHSSRALEQGIRQAHDTTSVASASKTTIYPKSYVAAAVTANQAVTPGLEVIDLLGFSNVTADSDTANSPLTKVDSYFCLSTKFIH